jgi:hypothetical protein
MRETKREKLMALPGTKKEYTDIRKAQQVDAVYIFIL